MLFDCHSFSTQVEHVLQAPLESILKYHDFFHCINADPILALPSHTGLLT